MGEEVAILLMSHGDFAREAIKSAELIVGKQGNYAVLGVHIDDGVDELKQEMFAKVDALDTARGMVVFTDITGGTPMNLAGNLLARDNVIVCTGLNLPILLECLLNRQKSVEEIKALVSSAYQNGMRITASIDLEKEENQDDLFL